jgi:hypothetical protein
VLELGIGLLRKKVGEEKGQSKAERHTYSIPEQSTMTFDTKMSDREMLERSIEDDSFEYPTKHRHKHSIDVQNSSILQVRPSSQIAKFFHHRKRYNRF